MDQIANVFNFFLLVNVGEDCPVFEGLFEFCSISAGGSIGKKMPIYTLSNVHV
jgi:hypothetical protein